MSIEMILMEKWMHVVKRIESKYFRHELALNLFEDLRGMPLLGIAASIAFAFLFMSEISALYLIAWLSLMTLVYSRMQFSLVSKKNKPTATTYPKWTWQLIRAFMSAALGWMLLPLLVLPTLSGWSELTFALMMFVIIALPLPVFSNCFPLAVFNPITVFIGTVIGVVFFTEPQQNGLFTLCTLMVGVLYLFLKYNRIALENIRSADNRQALTKSRQRLSVLEQEKVNDNTTGLPNFNGFTASFIENLKLTDSAYVISLKVKDAQNVYASQHKSVADELLKSCALRLMTIKLSSEHICHVGMGEFLIAGLDDAAEVRAKAFQAAFDVHVTYHGNVEPVHVCVGYALYPAESATPDNLVFHAMTAMNQSLSDGSREVVQFSPNLSSKIVNQLSLSKAIIPGLKHGEFELYYQPKYSANQKQIKSAEALLRWTSAEYGPISPIEFIPIAETTGDIVELGYWVLDQATEFLCSSELPTEFSVAVNLSIKQLEDEGLVHYISKLIKSLPAGRSLELELTESVLLTNNDVVSNALNQLYKRGVSLALDDFGTGYSSLSYLSRIEVNIVKLDKSFIDPVLHDKKHQVLVSSIIDLVQNLGLEIVAEGVENEDQLDWLLEHGCELIQGYYISRPLPEEGFIELVNSQPQSESSVQVNTAQHLSA